MRKNIWLLVAILIMYGCGKEKEFPIWEITKDGHPTSYLMASTEYLTENEVNHRLSDRIITFFDSCDTYISYWDLENSQLALAKKWIEIPEGKTLSQFLPHDLYTDLKEQSAPLYKQKEPIDSIRIRPQFFLYDLMNKKPIDAYSIDNLWLKKAMPSLKNLKGLVTYQDHYESLNKVYIPVLHTILTEDSLTSRYSKIKKDQRMIWVDASYENFPITNHPTNILFKSKEEENNYYSNQFTIWSNRLNNELKANRSFICLDAFYLFGDHNLRTFLLSKGYQLTRLN